MSEVCACTVLVWMLHHTNSCDVEFRFLLKSSGKVSSGLRFLSVLFSCSRLHRLQLSVSVCSRNKINTQQTHVCTVCILGRDGARANPFLCVLVFVCFFA